MKRNEWNKNIIYKKVVINNKEVTNGIIIMKWSGMNMNNDWRIIITEAIGYIMK